MNALSKAFVMAGAILLSTWGVAPSAAAKDDVGPVDSSSALVNYTEIAVGTRPESVARGFKNKLYVTTQGADNTATGGRRRSQGDDGTTVTTFATGLYEPKGIAYTGKYLIVADLARVWRIDASGNKVAIVDNDAAIPKPFYNDVTLAPRRQGRAGGGDGQPRRHSQSRDQSPRPLAARQPGSRGDSGNLARLPSHHERRDQECHRARPRTS